ncbi:MAG: hypothetical protein EOO61_20480 [Hymenobacter sp.]|nr:MAG: hypothetical protein EOO61_20480 [Hymenobacter sp.]
MIENDRIITCDWNEAGGIFEYDLSYLHSDLGVLVQEYRVSSMTYEGKRIYQSDFSLFAAGSVVPGNFSYLPKEIKNNILAVVFAVKRKFFDEYKPDIVEHFIDEAYSIEQRFELYKKLLVLPEYDIEIEKTKHTITYQKKKTPTGSGGGFLFARQFTPAASTTSLVSVGYETRESFLRP